MADEESHGTRHGSSPSKADEEALADLGQRIQAARKSAKWARSEPEKVAASSRSSDMGVALRLSSEMVSGVLVGAAIGWGIDKVFGISPICLIIFMGLGTVAGVRNVLRATREMDKARQSGEAKQDQAGRKPDDKR